MEFERRVRLVRFSIRDVIDLLNQSWRDRDWLAVPESVGLPDGYAVLSVYADPLALCIVATVYHPSFDEVADGEVPPFLDDPPLRKITAVKLERLEDDDYPRFVMGRGD